VETDAGPGWSYPFDAQTRHLFFAATTPNAVATTFVASALLDLHEHEDDPEALGLALESRPLLCSLVRRDRPGGPYFAYVPGGSEVIHNANVLVCGALARMHEHAPDDRAAELAGEALETTIAAQDNLGLWAYGDAANLKWADNFHTAYILEGLVATARAFGVGEPALRAGLPAWRESFFESADARLYADSPYPLEAHSYASAIDLCVAAAPLKPELIEFAERVAGRAIERLWLDREGRFAYRVTRLGTNRREFMRWTNAPMFRALARLVSERVSRAATAP
jgi:hypothetical protein